MAHKLNGHAPFNGVGVCTIHERSAFAPCVGMADDESAYLGKAEPRGRRQGRVIDAHPSPAPHKRLREHSVSIRAASNPRLRESGCRWLVPDPAWTGLTGQVLIATCRPTWNSVVDGFGSHDLGAGRRNQERSLRDTRHPGRRWAEKTRERQLDAHEMADGIAEHGGTGKQT